jgi:hypothetical protein
LQWGVPTDMYNADSTKGSISWKRVLSLIVITTTTFVVVHVSNHVPSKWTPDTAFAVSLELGADIDLGHILLDAEFQETGFPLRIKVFNPYATACDLVLESSSCGCIHSEKQIHLEPFRETIATLLFDVHNGPTSFKHFVRYNLQGDGLTRDVLITTNGTLIPRLWPNEPLAGQLRNIATNSFSGEIVGVVSVADYVHERSRSRVHICCDRPEFVARLDEVPSNTRYFNDLRVRQFNVRLFARGCPVCC